MRRLYFIYEDQEPYTRVSVETDVVVLDDVLREMENFLCAVGYRFNGSLEIVDWDRGNPVPEPSQDFLDHFEHRN